MGKIYANVIIDISHESVDRVFQYRIPEQLQGTLTVGQQVYIPFGKGNKRRKGYVVELTDEVEYDPDKLKEIEGIVPGSVSAQSQLIWLAWWMKEQYGSTMNQALKTVLPVKQQVKEIPKRTIRLLLDERGLKEAINLAQKRHYTLRLRILEALAENPVIPWEAASSQLGANMAALKPMEEQGIITLDERRSYRNPLASMERSLERRASNQGEEENGAGERNGWETKVPLNSRQQEAADRIWEDYIRGSRKTWLIHGITGSGKTEVYMELIERVLGQGLQVIVLIPEISLTWQTVMRFYRRFGDRVSVLNSRMSQGERYDQYERARTGEIDIIIGPRSALFAPFEHLGMIIMDEEHENAYKSELSPRYHAREVAACRAKISGAALILGSATPSLESYTRALKGEYGLCTLDCRAKADSVPPAVEVVDLRRELKEGNKSIFSRRLAELMDDRLERGEQMMLFINRRGYANFVSCRSCGEALRCPHCDVTLTLHKNGRLICHYCGYSIPMPKLCPVCGSPYIAPFGTGTQKIEELARKQFPSARILRMDLDTTSKKEGHQEILSAFARGEADILIGTQMIVKGHDFPRVTLVGALAADLSLYAPDYRCGEQTFDLLVQAAGRAGRGGRPGTAVIQTYQPDHYAVRAAASQDYRAFYEQEMGYRRLMGYPPAVGLLTVQLSSRDEQVLSQEAELLARHLNETAAAGEPLQLIGPVNAPVYKVNDIYRKFLYIKQENYDILIQIRKNTEEYLKERETARLLSVQYDLT